MVCTGAWNKEPPEYHPSYEFAGLTVVSFRSVRAEDCGLANSSSTDGVFGDKARNLSTNNPIKLGSWFAGPLRKKGNVVTVPVGVNGGEAFKLKIVNSRETEYGSFDILEGRDYIYGNYYYNFKCKAKVVRMASTILNNTKHCPN